MKTIKAMLLVVLAVLAANEISASGKVKFDKTTVDSEMAIAATSSIAVSQFEVDVRDGFGEVLYEMKKTAPANSFKKKYDFSALEDGTYWMSVKIDKEKTVNKFEVKNGNVEVQEIRKSTDPYIDFTDNKLKLTLLNHQYEDVKMYVYDMSRKLLYEKELGADFAIHHGLDLSKLRRGNYEIVLTNARDIFDHKVTVK